ncbi:hypothetical protein B2J93_5639 [Marssonina coronariae]|uniref:Uncharacterized protein n=1 Tax=Diplocarpon coronariae TaxID=2795749 RepID=A0A218ZAM6_9HELO|nr:hypothetical protein JHW43_007881 [Diplocarpon mali]OWP05121.1 hypothetical protein B2J93_5639 [Marssonina coronariae]
MPARERISYNAPRWAHGAGITQLKKHKILPHPREREHYPLAHATKPRNVVVSTGYSSLTSSDTSSPPTLKHTSKRIGAPILPPTPPSHSRRSSAGHPTLAPAPKFDISSTSAPSTPATSRLQQSPPTPDVTPPRAMPLAFRPPNSDRYSSRTDSFRTARENPYSSSEDEASTARPVLRFARTSAMEVPPLPKKLQKRKEVGLGLGLESDHEDTTPEPRENSLQGEFVVSDGEWRSAGEEEVEREWDDNLMRNVTVRKRSGRHANRPHLFTSGATGEVIEDDLVSPTSATRDFRALPQQKRDTRHRPSGHVVGRTSTEKLAESIAWSAAVADQESPSTPDVRRYSAMSVSSAVVEAMVVEAPPLRQRTLRHTKKHFGLRDVSSDQSTRSSVPNSVVSSERKHRLHRQSVRIPEPKHRSLASNNTISTTSSNGQSRKEILSSGGIPVVVIPERRSSSKPREPSLRSTNSKTKRSNSLSSAPLSQSSKFNEHGYFDARPSRERTVAHSAGLSHSVLTIGFPPSVSARRSSPSASKSRNTSRAGSLTAESLNAHNMLNQHQEAATTTQPEQSVLHVETEKELATHHNRLNVDQNGDPFFGKRLSTQATPFSQTSYETAGTAAEVSEAMAVTMFPHQNKSVLVVQHTPSSSEDSPMSLETLELSQLPPKMPAGANVTTGPVTPPQSAHPMDTVESPLKNPRDPPEPPAIKFIPPTPAALDSEQEEDRQLGFDIDQSSVILDTKPRRSTSLLRRTFSGRRNSEGSVPTVGLLKRTFSLSGGRRKDAGESSTQTAKAQANPSTLYPSVEDRPADAGKLHPFWRPARFWDDLDDNDFDDEYGYPPIDNRPAPPRRSLSQKLKRTFAILPIEDDHQCEQQLYTTDQRTVKRTPSGNMRVFKQRSKSSLRREGNNRRLYMENRRLSSGPEPGTFGYGFKEGNGGRVHTIPGLGLRIEYVGWSGIINKIGEKRRQQRSRKLRALISGPKGVQSGMDDVLRRRAAT